MYMLHIAHMYMCMHVHMHMDIVCASCRLAWGVVFASFASSWMTSMAVEPRLRL